MELRCIAQREGKLSSFLRRELHCSSSFVNKKKWEHCFFVNGVSQRTNYIVRPGDEIRIPIEEPTPDFPAQDGELNILYEDEAVIAVDKGPGVMMHPSFHRNTDTLANYLLGYYQRTGQACAIHPVSRLDRDTFGVVLLAKNAHVHAILHQAMKQGEIEKTYHAAVFGAPEADEGTISHRIARRPKPSLLRYVSPDGQEAQTRYQVLLRRNGCALLELHPLTGRTHQLRVHCAYEGFPILGDPQYGTEASMAFSETQGLTHQQLCARALTFPHPLTGERIRLESARNVCDL